MLNQEKLTHHPLRLSSGSTSSKKLFQVFSVNRDLLPSSKVLWFIPFILDLNHKIKSKIASQVLKVTFLIAPLVALDPPKNALFLSLKGLFPFPRLD